MSAQKRLGKGLGALLGDTGTESDLVARVTTGLNAGEERVQSIPINQIDPNPDQPRRIFEEEALQELAASIKEHGVLQPILVIRAQGGRYTLVAGERRWRASRMAGLKQIPAICRDMSEQQRMEAALIENLQRSDLNPIEEARAISLLMQQHGFTQETVAVRVGKSRPAVANMLRLLALPEEVQNAVQQGLLSGGHARAILMAPANKQLALAEEVIDKGLSVRQTEKLAQQLKNAPAAPAPAPTPAVDADLKAAERALQRALGTKVLLRGTSQRGKLTIEYFSREELERLYELLGGQMD
ncbi:MAG: ParB/RepB/Spo0J family partition protein [Clostridia bacterium]|nr:ParB/RepB/Spo0J family partition protein [Clostridia bacterium]